MKQTIFRTILLLTFLLAGAFVTVQAQHIAHFRATVPFDFSVSNQNLPAGRYELYLRDLGPVKQFRISNAEAQKSVTIFARPKATQNSTKYSKLIFRRYGNLYFLGEVWSNLEISDHEIAISNTEKRLRKQNRKDHFAGQVASPHKTESVVLTEQ